MFPKDPKVWATELAPVGALKSWLVRDRRASPAPYVDQEVCSLSGSDALEVDLILKGFGEVAQYRSSGRHWGSFMLPQGSRLS